MKNNSQKGGYKYEDILTENVLQDVCQKITGVFDYTLEFDNEGYNKGRLATLHYNGAKHFISFSETGQISGRNYFFQSITTALVSFFKESSMNKEIHFYFLDLTGNVETKYYTFLYRVMATAGVRFLNPEKILNTKINNFNSIDDLIAVKEQVRNTNRSNNSTYLIQEQEGTTEIYAKTYGANKKESVLITMAASILSEYVYLFEVSEQGLRSLPRPDTEALKKLQNIKIITTDITMERREFEQNNSLRSPKFIYNLLDRLGPKKCALCDCEIPQLIEGAHIWPVADIKNTSLTFDEKLECATDGNNGIWLCENHHSMYDQGILAICKDGSVMYDNDLKDSDKGFISKVTEARSLSNSISNSYVLEYLEKRYQNQHFLNKTYVEL